LLIAMETARVLDMGDCIQSAEGLPLLDKETKAKPAIWAVTMATSSWPLTALLRLIQSTST